MSGHIFTCRYYSRNIYFINLKTCAKINCPMGNSKINKTDKK
ncbi:Hypothetical protein ETEE_2972 [Edwardsiella anguillarum ET080813]|uniref:Uncharacterized protein n=1 Tax=Edwardsiella anguillarum ET080813 TaxID=667120 RepID=A0A076LNA3_9GAMM|nr:Hypothetical protein ETEE_2972 [Edwardsiella anguillarum ET080813]